MEKIIPQEEFDKLLDHPGKVRGVAFTTAAKFILEREGKKGAKKMEEAINQLGYPLKYDEIETMKFYPVGLQVANIMVMKRLFGYDNQDVREMGGFNAKSSLLVRLFMRYFVSIERAMKVAPKIWKKHYTQGRLEAVDYRKEEKTVVLRLHEFSVHPLLCEDLNGYFASVVQMVIGKKVQGEEIKCVHRGDSYHEFLLRW